ncbi:MAG: hypothetical protein Q9227_007590 [Pyrenula ochraceoflavens]
MLSQVVPILIGLVPLAAAVNLYVSSYAGTITTLSLLKDPDLNYTLTQTHSLETNTNAPSWLTLNHQNNVLYMIDEAVSARNGTLVSYKTSYAGALTEIQRLEALQGDISAELLINNLFNSISSSLQTYNVTQSGHFNLLQTFTYTAAPGPVPNRQDAPHLHEAILDPTQQYLLIPDLGADLVRILAIDSQTNTLTELSPLHTASGSGPRHGAFSLDPISGSYIFYLDAEISSTVTAYRVSYSNGTAGGLTFNEIGVYSSLAPGQAIPPTTTGESTGVAAEIAVGPDGSTLLVSNRRDLSFNNTSPPSDSLALFDINAADGTLTFQSLYPAGGSYARQFAINRAGDLVAVGLQQSGILAVFERDCATGVIGREVGRVEGLGQVTCAVWDE